MAIDNLKVIDGMGTNKEQDGIMLLLCDHLPWEGEKAPKMVDHLLLLQEKINLYITFLESKQYKEKYPDLELKMAVIDIRFQYEIPETCRQFLQTVEDRIRELGITLEVHIG